MSLFILIIYSFSPYIFIFLLYLENIAIIPKKQRFRYISQYLCDILKTSQIFWQWLQVLKFLIKSSEFLRTCLKCDQGRRSTRYQWKLQCWMGMQLIHTSIMKMNPRNLIIPCRSPPLTPPCLMLSIKASTLQEFRKDLPKLPSGIASMSINFQTATLHF